jgi:mannosylglycerate hydrolase
MRPENEARIHKAIKAGKISVGPMYVLPDEYLVSGESLIRNFMLGHKIAEKYGSAMKAGYIPDPFGHIAQLPQILSGFDVPTVLFARGFGNEFEDLGLDMEFVWDAPGKAASAIGVHLLKGYGSVAALSEDKDKNGIYLSALNRIQSTVKDLGSHSKTGYIILNNGTDHLFAQPHIPNVVKQWNQLKAAEFGKLVQADFGYYSNLLVPFKDQLKHYSGELHGGKYQYLLSGVYSARMWIKQENWRVQTILERYSEPISALSHYLTKSISPYPGSMLWNAWAKLLQNHPHDSICGCSIDEVHDIDMKARFFQAGELGLEIMKESIMDLSSYIKIDDLQGERFGFLVFNPLPWERSEIVRIRLFLPKDFPGDIIDEGMKIFDEEGKEYRFELQACKVEPRINFGDIQTFAIDIYIDKMPAFGYKVLYLYPGETSELNETPTDSTPLAGGNWIENEFYKVVINDNGSFNLIDKKAQISYPNLCSIEDVGDWGDEYDFSGPKANQKDIVIKSTNIMANWNLRAGPIKATADITYSLMIPHGLDEKDGRKQRLEETDPTQFKIYLELPISRPIVQIKLEWNNKSLDHRVQAIFPTNIKSNTVEADGHFYVIPRDILRPKDDKWEQKWLPSHHQHKFVSVSNGTHSLTVINKGLPEYEAKLNKDQTISIGVTLLRSIGWLSRGDFASRSGNAGPHLYTPGAQCAGKQICELAVTTGSKSWLESGTYWAAEEFNTPLQPAVPMSINSQHRIIDGITFSMQMGMKRVEYETHNDLPSTLSFLAMKNKMMTMTAIKKAEKDNGFIIRVLNLAPSKQSDDLQFYFPIKNAELVNYNEETPKTPIKASISTSGKTCNIQLEPFVLATIKIEF